MINQKMHAVSIKILFIALLISLSIISFPSLAFTQPDGHHDLIITEVVQYDEQKRPHGKAFYFFAAYPKTQDVAGRVQRKTIWSHGNKQGRETTFDENENRKNS